MRRPPTTDGGRPLSHRVDRAVVAEYRAAWKVIKAELARVDAQVKAARKAGETVNRAWLAKEARLGELERTVAAQIAAASRRATGVVTAGQADAVTEARLEAERLMRRSIPADVLFTARPSTAAFHRLIGNTRTGKPLGDLLAKLDPVVARRLRRKLATGLLLGRNPRAVARDLAALLGGNLSRARTIARTELMRVYREAARASYEANRDVVTGWVWEAEPDACEFCLDQEGTVFDVETELDSHPNAVLAGSTFRPYGQLREMVAARYSGPAVTLTVGADTLTIGPNHPMLTSAGWKRASLIGEGDQLVHDARLERSLPGREPDLEQVPLVEDAFEAFARAGGYQRVAAAAHDFHGDRVFCQGEVEVVRAADGLLVEADAPFAQHRRECPLVRADSELLLVSGAGAALSHREVVGLAATGGVGGGSASLPRLGAGTLGPAAVRLADRAVDAMLLHDPADGAAGDTEQAGYSFGAVACEVEGDDRLMVEALAADRAEADVAAGGPARLHVETDTAVLALDLDGHPFSLRAVTGVEWVWFDGLAFDASTSSGVYATNGYCIKNCRCAMIPQTAWTAA